MHLELGAQSGSGLGIILHPLSERPTKRMQPEETQLTAICQSQKAASTNTDVESGSTIYSKAVTSICFFSCKNTAELQVTVESRSATGPIER